jgi:hypothetical protein
MANAFESFIQLELPKRPYLETDVPQESLIVRRGVGPRQLAGLQLTEDQTVVYKNGQLVPAPYGSPSGTSSTYGTAHEQALAAQTWTIDHQQGNRNVVVTVLDQDYNEIISDSLEVLDNSIVISFAEPQAGFANVVFL